MPLINRRNFLVGAGGLALASLGMQLRAQPGVAMDLRTRRTNYDFGAAGLKRGSTQGVVSLVDNAPPPVIRLKQGQPAILRLNNGLDDDYTTMHWHGLRIPNEMDGVPYLTQYPLAFNEEYEYRYTPPDAGTYWYHPHCMTMSQMAQGLTGILVVEEDDDVGFDMDLPLNLKDFRLDDDAQLRDFFTPRGAARAGTLGNIMTTNWQNSPTYEVPAGGLVRLRIAVTDTTRIYKLALPAGLDGRVIAWDGHPLEQAIPMPTPENPLMMGPGQRIDIAVRVPDTGPALPILHQAGQGAHVIANLLPNGVSQSRDLAELKPLPRNPIAIPDVENAELRDIVFGWSPDGSGSNNGLCTSYPYSFWSIDRVAWPGDDASPEPGPVATLTQGKSYILRMRNETPNLHPIHLHGLVFKPLRSNKRELAPNYTDTILLLENETVEVALKADNPGDWAFHCHVIEHQKTGLSGYVRVV